MANQVFRRGSHWNRCNFNPSGNLSFIFRAQTFFPAEAVAAFNGRAMKQPMKFLYSHRTRSADGQYVHIRALTEALAARGHEIIMAGPEEESAAPRSLDAQSGGGLKSLLPRPLYECAEYGYSLPAWRRLAAKARAHAPDILYERYNLFFSAGAWLHRRSGLPMILEVNAPLAEERARHDGLALEGFARRSEAAIWRAADAVLPVTNVLADRLRAVGVEEERIHVIQNGVDPDFMMARDARSLRERHGLSDKLVLGFTGFVRDWHGVDRVVRFIAQSGRDDLHLLLVGDGPARPDLEALAASLGVAGQMTVTGVIQREAMADHVAVIDIALQPAVTDYASPLKLFEYMALGRPIIAPDSANIREVLTADREALLFDADSDQAFSQGLAALVSDADLRARLGAAAKARLLREDFTWAGNARRVEKIAETLTGDAP